jgi:cytochrome P450
MAYLTQLVSFTLFKLCEHPEYLEPLLEEIKYSNILEGGGDDVPLLDSFLKETSRIQPAAIRISNPCPSLKIIR